MANIFLGAIVLGNAWCGICYYICLELASTILRASLHDPTVYPDPDAFKPERFLNAGGEDPVLTSTFGVGKRTCPGRHFVDLTMFIVVASLLSAFKIEGGNGSDGGPDADSYIGAGIT
jgi:cytochrome P450